MAVVAGNYAGTAISGTQAMHANTIIGIGQQRGISHKGIVIALITAKVESNMGTAGMTRAVDHDSLGLFQQRPSQGWGTPNQVMNTSYATNKFYDVLLKVPGWQGMSHGAAAQAVQRSAFPGRYATWVPMAEAMAVGAGNVGVPSGEDGYRSTAVFPTVELGNLAAISDPGTWRRIGFFLLGMALATIGFLQLTGVGAQLAKAGKAIGKVVVLKKVAL